MRDLRGSLGSRKLSSRRDMQARNLASTLRIFSRFYTIMKGIIFRRDVIAPDLLSARGIVDNLSTESLNARGFSTQQRGLQTRNAHDVPSETWHGILVARGMISSPLFCTPLIQISLPRTLLRMHLLPAAHLMNLISPPVDPGSSFHHRTVRCGLQICIMTNVSSELISILKAGRRRLTCSTGK